MSARGHRADSAAMADVLERKKRGAEIALEPGAGARTGRNIIETGASLWDPQLCHFCVEGPLPEIVAQVLGVGTLHFFHDQVFKKEPGSGLRTPWHQDLPYFDLSGPCAVAWCPVDPVRMDNGAMCYIPGSHLDGRLYRPSDFVTSHGTFPGSDRDPSFSPLPRIDAAAEKELGAVYLDAEPGDVLVHDARTLHGSAGNVSGRVRRASSVRYVSGEARMVRREWSAIQWTNLIGVKDGELLAGDPGWYPKVWPRKSEGKGTRL
ncbi:hypothetical protein DFJ74DRAFT_693622 [Hyaloraphidium curvatum]|nr:hypothetical protein DFJ74DRAFT_693622 [Hyaloraphidium curvatum]